MKALGEKPSGTDEVACAMLHANVVTTVIKKGQKNIAIRPGEYHISDRYVLIETLLGSCVAACLYDPVNRVVGMNHFLLSARRYSREAPLCMTEAGRYGVHAMELLINGMFKLGAHRGHLRAKVFGGGSFFRSSDPSDNFLCVGEVNSRFILEFLEKDGIPLVARDLGGDRGRRIYFSSDDYSVTVKKTKMIAVSGVLRQEKRYWLKSMAWHEQGAEEADLWD